MANGHPASGDARFDGRVAGPGTEGRSFGALLKDFAEGGAALVKHEFRLAKTEAGQLARELGTGAAAVAAGRWVRRLPLEGLRRRARSVQQVTSSLVTMDLRQARLNGRAAGGERGEKEHQDRLRTSGHGPSSRP